jgi:hypothetical protein
MNQRIVYVRLRIISSRPRAAFGPLPRFRAGRIIPCRVLEEHDARERDRKGRAPSALNDAADEYTLRVTEVVSGVSAEAKVRLN